MLEMQCFQQTIFNNLLISEESIQWHVQFQKSIPRFPKRLSHGLVIDKREKLLGLMLVPDVLHDLDGQIIDILDNQVRLPVMLPVQLILQQLGIDRITADADIETLLLAERVNDARMTRVSKWDFPLEFPIIRMSLSKPPFSMAL